MFSNVAHDVFSLSLSLLHHKKEYLEFASLQKISFAKCHGKFLHYCSSSISEMKTENNFRSNSMDKVN